MCFSGGNIVAISCTFNPAVGISGRVLEKAKSDPTLNTPVRYRFLSTTGICENPRCSITDKSSVINSSSLAQYKSSVSVAIVNAAGVCFAYSKTSSNALMVEAAGNTGDCPSIFP